MDDGVYHRIHPLTIVVETVRFLGRFSYIIVIILISRSTDSRFDAIEVFFAAIGAVSILAAVLRYYFTVYSLDSQKIVIKTGVVFRQTRTIPLERIQNVELSRGILHQALGLADLKIETAGGAKAEGDLSALSVAEAQRLKDVLLRARATTQDTPQMPPQRAVYAATAKDLALLGATENRLLLILAAIFAPIVFIEQLGRDDLLKSFGTSALEGAKSLGGALPLIAVIATLALILFGWLASIVATMTRYHGFVLRSVEGQFERRYGLFTSVESVVPLPRIQTLCIEAPFLRRLLGYCTIHAGLAGSVNMQRGQQHATTSALCLLVKKSDSPNYVRRVFPHLDLNAVDWQPVSRTAIRRGAMGLAILPTIALVAWVVYSGNLPHLLGLLPIAAVSIWYGFARFKAMGFATTDNFFLTRSGILYHKIHIAPHGKIQWLTVDQNPIQRRYRIADINAGTAAVVGVQLGRPSVRDVEIDRAEALQDHLSARVEASGLWMPDGV